MATPILTFEYWNPRTTTWEPFDGHIIRGANKPIPLEPGDDIRLTSLELADGTMERAVIRVTYPQGRVGE